ncbi:hypothetical protein EC988_003378 [Linderina pennispora]|nr:hypothetical protein EC988_003378 [Linderina pennispora]
MRTVHRRRVFLFDDHLKRLAKSAQNLHHSGRWDSGFWQTLLVPLVRRGLDEFWGTGERKITVLIDETRVALQVEQLHVPHGSCSVQFAMGRRSNPEIKALDWVHQRARLEALIEPPVNEVVLEDGSRFYEGLSSNFFATRPCSESRFGLELVSAPLDSVLLGTVMKSVLDVCKQDGINVAYEPDVELERWSGAFVTSTSRLVLPVSRIVMPDGTAVELVVDPLVDHLRSRILELAVSRSVEI